MALSDSKRTSEYDLQSGLGGTTAADTTLGLNFTVNAGGAGTVTTNS